VFLRNRQRRNLIHDDGNRNYASWYQDGANAPTGLHPLPGSCSHKVGQPDAEYELVPVEEPRGHRTKEAFQRGLLAGRRGLLRDGLDSQKRQITSIGSNPGHCIACGIVNHALVRRTAERLMADDMFSGWGVRTLSALHSAFNPFSYHRGTVWPVEHGTFAIASGQKGVPFASFDVCHASRCADLRLAGLL